MKKVQKTYSVLSKEIDIEVVDFFNTAKEALNKLDFEDLDLLITELIQAELCTANSVLKSHPSVFIKQRSVQMHLPV